MPVFNYSAYEREQRSRTLATQPYVHQPRCSGCPLCNAEMRSLLSMSTLDYSNWLTAQTAQAFRSLTIHHNPVNTEHRGSKMSYDRLNPPSPYRDPINAIRAAQGLPPLPEDVTTITAAEVLDAMSAQHQSRENHPTMSNERRMPQSPYVRGLAALRVADGLPAIPDDDDNSDISEQLRAMAAFRDSFYELLPLVRSTSEVYSNPPDPYAPGLAEMRRKLKEEEGR